MIAPALKVRYDEEWDIVHIDNCRYAGDFFRRLQTFKPGDRLELVEVVPGKLNIRKAQNEKN